MRPVGEVPLRDAGHSVQLDPCVRNGIGISCFCQGASKPFIFRCEYRRINLVLHGDDVLSEGEAHELTCFDVELRKHFELKTQVLGPDVKKVCLGYQVLEIS